MSPRQPWPRPAAWALAALLLSVGAWTVLGARLDGYRLWAHPFALPGAHGLPGAEMFNALVFVLPGAVMALLAARLRQHLPPTSGWGRRIGCSLALLAALGWAGQGLLPLDLAGLDAAGSRWHALAWSCWWMAAANAALLMLPSAGLRVWGAALVVMLLLPGALADGSPLSVLAQPVQLLLWGGWMWAACRRMDTGIDPIPRPAA